MGPYFFVSFCYAKTYPLRESVEIRTFVNYISMSSGRNTLEFSDTICYYLSWKVLDLVVADWEIMVTFSVAWRMYEF